MPIIQCSCKRIKTKAAYFQFVFSVNSAESQNSMARTYLGAIKSLYILMSYSLFKQDGTIAFLSREHSFQLAWNRFYKRASRRNARRIARGQTEPGPQWKPKDKSYSTILKEKYDIETGMRRFLAEKHVSSIQASVTPFVI